MDTIKYLSNRGKPLITQEIIYINNEPVDTLTMENYEKWYSMYIIRKDGYVEERFNTLTDDGDDTCWIDHAVVPYAFHETAKNLGLCYDSRTFAMVCERFVEDVLDGDWTKLSDYLPR